MSNETLTTTPCPRCGHETYMKSNDDMVYCSESDMPVLVCEALPIWTEMAHAEGVERLKQDFGQNTPKKATPFNPNATETTPETTPSDTTTDTPPEGETQTSSVVQG
jgi:hypothetical protein